MSHILVRGVKGNLHALPEDLNILLTFKIKLNVLMDYLHVILI